MSAIFRSELLRIARLGSAARQPDAPLLINRPLEQTNPSLILNRTPRL